MRLSKYIVGVWAAVAVYTIFSFLGGPKGISSYNYLLAERDRQWENISELGILNEDLERAKNNLLYDEDTLLVHARQMGYGQKNEQFVRIVGLGNKIPVPAAAGNVYSAGIPDFISSRSVNIAAICVGLLIFAFIFVMEIIENRSK